MVHANSATHQLVSKVKQFASYYQVIMAKMSASYSFYDESNASQDRQLSSDRVLNALN